MRPQLIVSDQINGRPGTPALVVEWQDSVPLTARTLISERVRIEWEARESDRETRARAHAAPLVNPDMMRRSNRHRGAPAEPSKPVTVEDATALALDGFVRNAFFLVVDGKQVTDLNETIAFRPTSQVTFVRLLPLVGG